MRVLLLLRGSAGCGKTTWIKEHGLENYALSADEIRMLCSSPVLTVSGKEQINQANDMVVWSTLFKLLEIRMQNGEFTVIDATNSKTSEMNRYKELCSTYKYRIYCVDFTDIPIETVKARNLMRPEVKQVPEEAIEKMYSRFQTQKIPSGITVIKPDELDRIWMKQIDLNKYKKIHHIGDIHGCHTALSQYLSDNGGIKDDEFYIFCGDYIDRGIENAEVINFLLSIYEKPNVCLLEGNHERHLWVWANDGVSKSKEFELVTKTALDNAQISKKDVRQLYRKIGQCAYYTYAGNTYLVTHAGLSTIPKNVTTVATEQMVKGVGNYNDFEAVAEAFAHNTAENCYQIHGHRNTKHLPMRVHNRTYNLEGQVEFGGCLRCLQITPGGIHTEVEVQNTVFKKPESVAPTTTSPNEQTIGDVIISLRQNKYVQEKQYGNISSFNFTKTAFYDKIWDEQTTKARGLYINVPKQKVIARAYDKFFNVNERPETKFDMLQHKLVFPVTAYVKENGYLGIVSYNEEDESLFVTTKSSPDGEFAVWLKDMLHATVSEAVLDDMKNYSKEHNVSFVFECVDMENDPHIIEYDRSQLFLLDIVYNDMTYRKYDFASMCAVADKFGLQHKEKAFEFETWQDFFDWYYVVTSDDYKYNGNHIEGFVVEDANGYMVKLKLAYYNFWKFMRSIAHETLKKGYIDKRRTSALTTPLANQFYGWLKTMYTPPVTERRKYKWYNIWKRLFKKYRTETVNVAPASANVPKDICILRKMFYETEAGSQFKNE